jgi:phage shock protein A
MSDVGMAVQRAEDKTAQMQARASAVDELVASGALTDAVSDGKDDISAELDRAAASGDVELEMAKLKAQLGAGADAPAQIEGATDSAEKEGQK